MIFVLLFAACQPIQPAGDANTAPIATAAATEAPAEAAAMAGDPVAGAYVFSVVEGGCGCHFNKDLSAVAGGNKFEGPFGVVYAANITPDKDTGIGSYTEDQLVTVLRTGARPDGSQLAGVMPYRGLSIMADKDVHDLAAYLLAQPAVANKVEARALTAEPEPFTAAEPAPATAPSEPAARGKYLVTLIGCGRCHTPKNEAGSPKADMFLAGGPFNDKEKVANITPDEETGIGKWTEEQIATFMHTGTRPDGKQVEGTMAQAIDRRFSKLTDEDAAAIASTPATSPGRSAPARS